MKSLTAILFMQFFLGDLNAQESSFLKMLFDSSDVIVQGVIAGISCIGYSYGVQECSYKLSVDSIYKGLPKISPVEFVVGFDPGNRSGQYLEILRFSRDCFMDESCQGRNQRVIVFLRDTPSEDDYRLTDRWLGLQSYSMRLAAEIRRLQMFIAH